MAAMVSQMTSLMIVYSTVYSGTDQRKHQSSASLAFVRGIHRRPVNTPHKRPVTRKMFPFDDVIMMIPHDNMLHAPRVTPFCHFVLAAKLLSADWSQILRNDSYKYTKIP